MMDILVSLLPVILIISLIYYFFVYPTVKDQGDKARKRILLIFGSIVSAVLIVALITSFSAPEQDKLKEIRFSEVVRQSNKGEVKRIEVRGDELFIIKKGETAPTLKSRKANGSSLSEQGIDTKKVEILIR